MNIIPFKCILNNLNTINCSENYQKKEIFSTNKINSNFFNFFIERLEKKKLYGKQKNKISFQNPQIQFNKNNTPLFSYPEITTKQENNSRTFNYTLFKDKDVLVKIPKIILEKSPIIIGASFPVDVESVRVIISDHQRNIIFQKDLGPAKKGENIFKINSQEIDKKYFSKDNKNPKTYHLSIVAKTSTTIVPNIIFTKGHVKDVFISSANDVFLNIDGLGIFSLLDIIRIL
ncbi:Basal-body rod modification protein FlgD [Buchnera aphidicola (Sipha maydis)]|uniref:hypothetical protein n=1 Tax=Buchnera aphidicola TaxID=9 RepID=UPI003463E01A